MANDVGQLDDDVRARGRGFLRLRLGLRLGLGGGRDRSRSSGDDVRKLDDDARTSTFRRLELQSTCYFCERGLLLDSGICNV